MIAAFPATGLSGALAANAGFGLLAALLWGGGDFGGSIAVKRAGGTIRAGLAVVVIGHLLSLAVITLLAVGRDDPFMAGSAARWAIGGGLISGISLMAFYQALGSGQMGPAAAVSGLLCAAVPALVSAFTEGLPSLARLVGFLCAFASIWLIANHAEENIASSADDASAPPAGATRRAILFAALSGTGFGVYFVSLKYAGESGLLWPMVWSRVGSAGSAGLTLLLLTSFASREALPSHAAQERWRTLAWIVGGAALDTSGNLSFLAATRAGRLDVAAVLASIYPASTILLAAALLKEKTTATQRWGMALALPAVVLITL